ELLMDARLPVRQGGRVVRSAIQRNWLSGSIRLAGLPPFEGGTLSIEALGWKPLTVPLPPLHAQSERVLAPLHLRLDEELLTTGIVRPALGHPTLKRPGDPLRLELAPSDSESAEPRTLTAVRWVQS
ncbi:MAG TPA: hypothetical protein PLA50_17395, partial [Bacteroidia bacterium]|nr:hypothetical protein [Bacteroidia bacterium]